MPELYETLRELGAAWLMWAENFVSDAAQMPYRRAVVIAFSVGAIMAWFAAAEWNGAGEEDEPKTSSLRKRAAAQVVYRCIDCGHEEAVSMRKSITMDGNRCNACGRGRIVPSDRGLKGCKGVGS